MNDEVYEIWPTLSPFGAQPQLFNLCRNKKEDKNMFEQFKNNSLKVIKVSGLTFELIADHEVRAISVETRHLDKLKENSTFAIKCTDAAIICSVVDLHDSSVDRDFSVIEFEIKCL